MLQRLPKKPELSAMDKVIRLRCDVRDPKINVPCSRHEGHGLLRLKGNDWPNEFRGLQVLHVGVVGDVWYAW